MANKTSTRQSKVIRIEERNIEQINKSGKGISDIVNFCLDEYFKKNANNPNYSPNECEFIDFLLAYRLQVEKAREAIALQRAYYQRLQVLSDALIEDSKRKNKSIIIEVKDFLEKEGK